MLTASSELQNLTSNDNFTGNLGYEIFMNLFTTSICFILKVSLRINLLTLTDEKNARYEKNCSRHHNKNFQQ